MGKLTGVAICEECLLIGRTTYTTSDGKVVVSVADWHVLYGSIYCDRIVYFRGCTKHAEYYIDKKKILYDRCDPPHLISEVLIQETRFDYKG